MGRSSDARRRCPVGIRPFMGARLPSSVTGSPFVGAADPSRPAGARLLARAKENGPMQDSMRKAFLDEGAVLIKGVLSGEQLAQCRAAFDWAVDNHGPNA